MQKLLRTGFFHIFSSNVLNKILTFLSNIIVVRLISKFDYGVFAYADNIVSMVLLATGMGLVSATFQLASEARPEDHEEQERIYAYGSSKAIQFNILLSIIIIIVSQFFPLEFESAKEYLLLLSANPILLIMVELQQIYLRSRKKNKEFSFASSTNTLLVVMGAVIGALIATVDGMIIGRACGYIITILIICYKFKIPINLKVDKNCIESDTRKVLFKIAFISMLNNGISQLMYLLDVFLLGLIVASETVIASYKVATVIPTAMTFIPSAVVMYIYPYFASKKDDKKWCSDNYKKILKYFGICNLLLSIMLIILAEPIIVTLYGKQYVDAVLCFRILSINYFFSGTFRIISGNLLVTQRKLGFNVIINVVSGATNIIGNLLLIPKYGSVGAAVTTLVVVLVSSVLSTSYYAHILKKGE